ncbi:MAG: hypothetical protein ACYC09_00950 [Bacteroidota bacterium]
MSKKRLSIESIIAMLREADVLIAKGQPLIEIVRQFGISDAIYNPERMAQPQMAEAVW